MVRAASEGGGQPICRERASGEIMAGKARDDDKSEGRPFEEAALSARLRRLGDQLDRERASRPAETSAARPSSNMSGFARGFRLSSELVAGVLVGAVIGWSLDHWLGISPWGMIVFLLLGFAAGVLNVMRTAGVLPSRDAGES
jgi:ATP synthase protein I